MLVRMLVELSGPGMLLAPGDEREFPDAEAIRLIAAEYAVPVAERQVERAVLEQPAETRAPHGRRGRPRREH
jgi:hypothetical protein